MDKVKFYAARPKNTSLNIEKLKQILKVIPSIKQGVKEFKEDYYSKY
jgi:dTDP-4-dehydrorhamnose reductase